MPDPMAQRQEGFWPVEVTSYCGSQRAHNERQFFVVAREHNAVERKQEGGNDHEPLDGRILLHILNF